MNKFKVDDEIQCYKGFTDNYGDRARKGQKFKIIRKIGNDVFVIGLLSGRGSFNIIVPLEIFDDHFTQIPKPQAKVVNMIPKVEVEVEAILHGGDWDDLKKVFHELPPYVQELLKISKPGLFDVPEPKQPEAFEFKEDKNVFSISGLESSVLFFVGQGLVGLEDKLKCIVVKTGYNPVLFKSSSGIRFYTFR